MLPRVALPPLLLLLPAVLLGLLGWRLFASLPKAIPLTNPQQVSSCSTMVSCSLLLGEGLSSMLVQSHQCNGLQPVPWCPGYLQCLTSHAPHKLMTPLLC